MSTPASVVAGTPADHGGVPPTSAAEIMPRSPLDKPLAELTQGDIAQLTRDDARRFLKSKAIQQVISLKGLLEGTPGCDNCPAGVGIFQKSSPPPARVFPLQVVILCFSFIHKVPKQRPYSHPISCFFSPGLVSSRSEVRRRIAAAGEGAVTVPEEGSDPSVLLRRSGPPSPAGGSLPLSQVRLLAHPQLHPPNPPPPPKKTNTLLAPVTCTGSPLRSLRPFIVDPTTQIVRPST
ncbi:hypothetical protein BHE74_00031630 [Ensete ventricosum]|nr:hypothetical protein BHE74_00031630 [Ensete ventricosum]